MPRGFSAGEDDSVEVEAEDDDDDTATSWRADSQAVFGGGGGGAWSGDSGGRAAGRNKAGLARSSDGGGEALLRGLEAANGLAMTAYAYDDEPEDEEDVDEDDGGDDGAGADEPVPVAASSADEPVPVAAPSADEPVPVAAPSADEPVTPSADEPVAPSADEPGHVSLPDSPMPRKRKGQLDSVDLVARKHTRRQERCREATARFRDKKHVEARESEAHAAGDVLRLHETVRLLMEELGALGRVCDLQRREMARLVDDHRTGWTMQQAAILRLERQVAALEASRT